MLQKLRYLFGSRFGLNSRRREFGDARDSEQVSQQQGVYARRAELSRLGDSATTLGVIDMVLSADEWVHRRVEQVEIQTASHGIRRVSLDFTVPNPCAAQVTWFDGRRHTLVPLDVLKKGHLQSFSLKDEAGRPLSVLTRRQNGWLASEGLRALAAHELARIRQTAPVWLEQFVRTVAEGSPDDARREVQRLEKVAESDPVAASILSVPGFRTSVDLLSDSFLLIAVTDAAPGTRVILKYEHEIAITSEVSDSRRVQERWLGSLGWSPTPVSIPVPSFADCESFHFEVSAPEGLELVDIVLNTGEAGGEYGRQEAVGVIGYRMLHKESPHRGHLLISRTVEPKLAAKEFDSPEVKLRLRVERRGWFGSATITAALVTLFFSVSLPWVWAMDGSHSPNSCTVQALSVVGQAAADDTPTTNVLVCETGTSVNPINADPAALTVALISVASLAVIRVGEHAYTARLLRPLRFAALLSAGLPLVGAWLMVFPGPGDVLRYGWLALTLVEIVLALALGAIGCRLRRSRHDTELKVTGRA